MKMIKQAFCREMHAFDALWHEIHLTLREIPRIFASREAVVFLILTALTLLFLDPHGFLDYVSLPVAAMVWIYAEAAFALVYFTLLLLTVMLWRGQKCVIYLPIYSGIAFFFATLIIEGSISIISKGAYEFRFQMDLLLFAIVAQLFEFLFVRYVLPDVMAKLKQEDAERESRRAQFKLGDWACAIEDGRNDCLEPALPAFPDAIGGNPDCTGTNLGCDRPGSPGTRHSTASVLVGLSRGQTQFPDRGPPEIAVDRLWQACSRGKRAD